MERSERERFSQRELDIWDDGWQSASEFHKSEDKARFDRYVCAVISGILSNGRVVPDTYLIAEDALQQMLAADKRWEEYTKGETP